MCGGFSAIYNKKLLRLYQGFLTTKPAFWSSSLLASFIQQIKDLFMIHAYARHNVFKPDMARETMF